MNKLICVLLIASMSWVSLPVKAESAEVEALRAETQTGFNNVFNDVQTIDKMLKEQNAKITDLTKRVTQLEKRRKTKALKSLVGVNHDKPGQN